MPYSEAITPVRQIPFESPLGLRPPLAVGSDMRVLKYNITLPTITAG